MRRVSLPWLKLMPDSVHVKPSLPYPVKFIGISQFTHFSIRYPDWNVPPQGQVTKLQTRVILRVRFIENHYWPNIFVQIWPTSPICCVTVFAFPSARSPYWRILICGSSRGHVKQVIGVETSWTLGEGAICFWKPFLSSQRHRCNGYYLWIWGPHIISLFPDFTPRKQTVVMLAKNECGLHQCIIFVCFMWLLLDEVCFRE